MSLVSDRERERAAASLRRHYLQGRLTLEELAERVQAALDARSRADLRRALRELPPPWFNVEEIGAATRHVASRAVTFVALAGLWLCISVLTLVWFIASAALGGVSTTETLVGFLFWAAMSYGLWRVWRRGAQPRA